MSNYLSDMFGLKGQVAIVTGATGVLGGAMAHGLAQAGAAIGVLGRRRDRAEELAAAIRDAGGEALALPADVMNKAELATARDAALQRWGRIDILLNAAGGNVAAATVPPDGSFFQLEDSALRQVIDLNLLGTLIPIQVFGEAVA